MAQYEHLPIYKRSYDLMVFIENAVRQFSRYNRYSIGSELRENSRGIVRMDTGRWVLAGKAELGLGAPRVWHISRRKVIMQTGYYSGNILERLPCLRYTTVSEKECGPK